MNYKIEEIEGIAAARAAKLAKMGITTPGTCSSTAQRAPGARKSRPAAGSARYACLNG